MSSISSLEFVEKDRLIPESRLQSAADCLRITLDLYLIDPCRNPEYLHEITVAFLELIRGNKSRWSIFAPIGQSIANSLGYISDNTLTPWKMSVHLVVAYFEALASSKATPAVIYSIEQAGKLVQKNSSSLYMDFFALICSKIDNADSIWHENEMFKIFYQLTSSKILPTEPFERVRIDATSELYLDKSWLYLEILSETLKQELLYEASTMLTNGQFLSDLSDDLEMKRQFLKEIYSAKSAILAYSDIAAYSAFSKMSKIISNASLRNFFDFVTEHSAQFWNLIYPLLLDKQSLEIIRALDRVKLALERVGVISGDTHSLLDAEIKRSDGIADTDGRLTNEVSYALQYAANLKLGKACAVYQEFIKKLDPVKVKLLTTDLSILQF